MASEREWQPLTAEKFLREDAPRVELVLPTDCVTQGDFQAAFAALHLQNLR